MENISFKGYDARSLKAVVMRDACKDENYMSKIADELINIGKNKGFDVYIQQVETNDIKHPTQLNWLQDFLTFLSNNKLLGMFALKNFDKPIAEYFGYKHITKFKHISGGNYFIVDENGKNSLIIGKDELNRFSVKRLKRRFDVENVYPVSQPDFHIDMGIRPLDNKTVLIGDDEMVFEKINEAIEKGTKYLKFHYEMPILRARNNLIRLRSIIKPTRPHRATCENNRIIAEELKNYGFNPVLVPGTLLRPAWKCDDRQLDSHYLLNYINAIVHINNNGELIYITNKSNLDEICKITPEFEEKIGFSFEKMFIDSVKDYILPKNIHFINGDGNISELLEYAQGGIHCLCAEILK